MSNIRSKVGKLPLVGPLLRSTKDALMRSRWYGKRAIMDRSKLHDFWRTPEPEGNVPTEYILPEATARSETLLRLIQHLPKDARILEVGCNAGRNVAYLFNAGYRNVEAVEISPHAVALLRRTFPELADVPIHVGAAEEVLPTFPDKRFDLVFTMAVLEHIHPDSVEVFDNIARIAKSVLSIEPTAGHVSIRQFPHDLPQEFGSRGFRLAGTEPLDGELHAYSAYRFVQ